MILIKSSGQYMRLVATSRSGEIFLKIELPQFCKSPIYYVITLCALYYRRLHLSTLIIRDKLTACGLKPYSVSSIQFICSLIEL